MPKMIELTQIIRQLEMNMDPSARADVASETVTIKQPEGTRKQLKTIAETAGVPFRDVAKACFEHGFAVLQKEHKRLERLAAQQSKTSYDLHATSD